MKKIVLAFISLLAVTAVAAQNNNPLNKVNLAGRAGDHLMIQLATDHWTGAPDSISSHLKGLSRGANIYIMMNKPFKNNPRLSAAFGVGVGTSNMYFKTLKVDITSTKTILPFTSLDSTDRFKKYKLTTAYLEIPVELRFTDNPEKNNKSFKAALGIKVGTLLNVHTKGKNLQNKTNGNVNSFTEKENSKRYFNSTRLSVTGRIGLGNFSLFGSYQINNLLKNGVGPDIKPFQVGLCLSGL